ncbi:MAG: hypothetical protein A2745_00250 [Candidatus Harrisonbacteria bacterium RIFCSPHIGHO2_01_FULL_44_13]|uniref:Uncharacterized protein n=1 Tax=Candidatus Harrisonbacteria bacterium RIFCSPLOWO2_01_FULL_44_18 TaxID=1798407 RepID=A0A1G1ZMM7_9BACT|nr:MAG: hypothetical protein A2745_00250 [Candidatus Harrisonbacteria bacterium RIFCSPHIGHO2_01_FULL_44_13]OGY65918.1 MAG: hypothetical protein A3A16_00845 [Candidatus Harrisonbacteria bacterium RIFCSPLOWO2_01_FULL_44_18]
MTKQSKDKKIEERYFGVILENMDSKLDLLVEGRQVSDKKIDRVDGKVDDFRKEVDYKFEVVFDELRIIRNELKEKVGREEFALLEKKVLKLEKVINRQN